MADEARVCCGCGNYIWEKKDGIRLFDNHYHRRCLEKAFAELDIHIELVRMGLDKPVDEGEEVIQPT